MREAIRQLLINGVSQVGGRVYEPQAAGATTQKPYLVLREGVQDPEADWAAFSTVIEVWPYVKRTTFQEVDSIANTVINTLHRTRFTDGGEQYLVDYLGTAGQDFVDEDWDVITRGLRFRVFALGWLNGLTYDPDPVTALRDWTATTKIVQITDENVGTGDGTTTTFYVANPPVVPDSQTIYVDGAAKSEGTDYTFDDATGEIVFAAAPASGAVITATYWPEVHTDPATWNPTDTKPGIYWRMVRLTPAEMTAAVSWLNAQLAAHILAPSPSIRLQCVRKLTEALATQRRISLSDGSPLEFMAVSADSEADPMRRGQVQLTARFGVLTPVTTVPVLNRAVVSGATTGEVT